MNSNVTLGQFLDLIDKTRSDEHCTIRIMQEGACLCSGMTCWEGWKFLENRVVDCVMAEDADCFAVWLKDSEK